MHTSFVRWLASKLKLLVLVCVAPIWQTLRRLRYRQPIECASDADGALESIAPPLNTLGGEQMAEAPKPNAWQIYERVSPQERLKQGDLIEFGGEDTLRRFGLVVTADCDLEQRKHGQLITLVPLVDVRTVVEHYLLLEELDRQRDNIWAYVRKKFNITGDINDPIVVAELHSLIVEAQAKGDQPLLCLAANARLHQLDKISSRDFCEVMRAAGISTDKTLQRLENQIKSKGDLVVVPQPGFLKEKVDVIWVRQVWQVPIRNIVFKNSEAKDGLGFRVARLESPFRYRVTQVMGQVFADIGTPLFSNTISDTLKGIITA